MWAAILTFAVALVVSMYMLWTAAPKRADWHATLSMAASTTQQPGRGVRKNRKVRVAGGFDPPPPWMTAGVRRARPAAAATPQVFLGVRVCGLEPCMLHGANATRLFVDLPNDGCGSRILRILQGMGVAARAGMNFGGAVGKQRSYPNGNDFRGVVDDFFGGGAADELLREEIRHDNRSLWHAKWETRGTHRKAYTYPKPFGDAVLLYGKEPVLSTDWLDKTPGVVASVMKPFAARATAFAAGRPSVAMHVRRGDLPTSHIRIFTLEYFYDVASVVRAHLPDADIHVFSSTLKDHMPTRGVWEHRVMYDESYFDGFRQRGMTVHLDDSDLMVPWTHFVRADVFVSSKSDFSNVAMFLGRGCVVWGGFWPNTLVERARSIPAAKGTRLDMNRNLRACLQHIGLTSRWEEAAPQPPP